MNAPIVLSPDADRDFEEATLWYHRKSGNGEAFVAAVEYALDRIKSDARTSRTHLSRYSSRSSETLSYNIYYRLLTDRIEVIAVFHTRRGPKTWQARV